MYGAAGAQARRESDAINPLTAYARSKVMTEQRLRQMNLNGMTITCLRFGTACGMSARLRLDLVLLISQKFRLQEFNLYPGRSNAIFKAWFETAGH